MYFVVTVTTNTDGEIWFRFEKCDPNEVWIY